MVKLQPFCFHFKILMFSIQKRESLVFRAVKRFLSLEFRNQLTEAWERLLGGIDCIYLTFHKRRVVAFVSPRFTHYFSLPLIAKVLSLLELTSLLPNLDLLLVISNCARLVCVQVSLLFQMISMLLCQKTFLVHSRANEDSARYPHLSMVHQWRYSVINRSPSR